MNAPGNPLVAANHGLYRQHPANVQALHEQQQVPHHQPQPHHFSNANSLLDHQFENRPFAPDGMVPGLRPPRSRESSGAGPLSAGPLYSDTLDDSPFTVQQRLPTQQVFEHRASMPQLYSNQAPGANRNPGMFPFRAEPSPLGQQRLPPGLANLGGRPPHDPNGYLGGMGMSGGGMHGPGGGHPQQFNSHFGGGGGGGTGLGFGGGTLQAGRPLPMQTLLNNAHNALAASGHPDFTVQHHPGVRGPPPGPILQGAGNGSIRGVFPPQGTIGGPGHMQGPPVGMRQQHGPGHLLPQMLPPHLQQSQQAQVHSLPGGGHGQNDQLLSMLMSGMGPRE